MYYPDLTPFTYSRAVCGTHVLNIGWLSRSAQFPIGDTSEEFRRALRKLAENPVHLCAGRHKCEFCDFRRLEIPAGNGEIHVPAAAGSVVYAAPELVPHYVEEHRYLPPTEFIEAVVAYRAMKIPWEGIRTYWEGLLPLLDEKWNQWRFFQDGSLVEIYTEPELPAALDFLQRLLLERLRFGAPSNFKLEVLRASRNPHGGIIEIEQSRHEINGGPFSPTLRSCACHP